MLYFKSQIAVEFLVFVSLALAVSVIFISISSNNARELQRTREFFLVKDIATNMQNEIDIASQVEDGYERTFTIPSTLYNIPYNISLNNNILSVWTKNTAHEIAVPNSTGNIIKGSNTIRKVNNAIAFN